MFRRRGGFIYRFWDAEHGPFGLLAVTVFMVFVISPLVVMGLLNEMLVDGFFALILFAGVLTVRPRPYVRYFVLFLVVLEVLTRAISRLLPGMAIIVIEAVVVVAAIGFFAALVVKQFLVAERPTAHRIGAAIEVYLLIGLMWGRLYEIAGVMIPGAFNIEVQHATITSYLYFSFVTLATVGYGDISPVHPMVRNLAVWKRLPVRCTLRF